jgi:hypothetical protein
MTTRAFSRAADQNDARERAGAQSFLTRFQVAISQAGGRQWLKHKRSSFNRCIEQTHEETKHVISFAALLWFGLLFLNIIPAPHQTFPDDLLAQMVSDSVVFLVPLILLSGFFHICRFAYLCHSQRIPRRWWQSNQTKSCNSLPSRPTLTEIDELGRPHSNPASGLPLTHGGGMDMGGNPNGSSR